MADTARLDYIELPASDFDAVQRFYEQAFGWHFENYGPDYRAFAGGRLDGGFFRSDHRSSQAEGAALVIFRSDDLEATQSAIERAGGRIVKPVFDFPGGRRFHFADPHGNELAVWSSI